MAPNGVLCRVNNTGPITDPWGTWKDQSWCDDRVSLIKTDCFRWLKYDLDQSNVSSTIFNTFSQYNSGQWSIVYYQIHRAGCGPLPRCVNNYREIALYLKQSRTLKFRLHALPKTPTIPFRIRLCLNLITTTRLMIFDKWWDRRQGQNPYRPQGPTGFSSAVRL